MLVSTCLMLFMAETDFDKIDKTRTGETEPDFRRGKSGFKASSISLLKGRARCVGSSEPFSAAWQVKGKETIPSREKRETPFDIDYFSATLQLCTYIIWGAVPSLLLAECNRLCRVVVPRRGIASYWGFPCCCNLARRFSPRRIVQNESNVVM